MLLIFHCLKIIVNLNSLRIRNYRVIFIPIFSINKRRCYKSFKSNQFKFGIHDENFFVFKTIKVAIIFKPFENYF